VSGVWASKIALVDTAKVVKEYQRTKDAQTRLEKEFEDKKTELKKMNDKLEKQQQDLTTKKGVVSRNSMMPEIQVRRRSGRFSAPSTRKSKTLL